MMLPLGMIRLRTSKAFVACPIEGGRLIASKLSHHRGPLPEGLLALCNHANAADQCALLVPMDTTAMIGATDDQSHSYKV